MVAIDSVSDARAFLAQIFAAQLERSVDEKAAPNEAVEGDVRARRLFRVVLPLHAQRTFFLDCVKDRRYWPRLRTLCGAPPYEFLLPEDNAVLNAAGICRGRSNMSRLENAGISSSIQFESHFQDDHERAYKIVAMRDTGPKALPWRDLTGGKSVVADVRLTPRRLATKRGELSGVRAGISKRSLAFPRPGEELRLSPATTLASVAKDVDAVTARVVLGKQSDSGSHLARLVLLIV